MRIHVKLTLWLLSGLILTVTAAQIVQHRIVTREISKLTDINMDLLKDREEKNAHNIFISLEQAVAGSLERGEMEKFSRLLDAQRRVKGLTEFSLYDNKGVVTHSSDASFINKRLPPDLAKPVYQDKERLNFFDDKFMEIYQPHIVNNDCIRCHMDWKLGEVGGVSYFRFSLKALQDAKREVANTMAGLRKASLWVSVVSVASVVLVLILVSYFLVKNMVGHPLEKISVMFEDIAKGEGDLTVRLLIDANDETGRMAKWFNIFIENLQGMISHIAKNADILAQASENLSGLSGKMSQSAEDSLVKSNNVAAATEQMSANMASVAASMEEASTNVDMVATSTEQMSGTIIEIAKNSENARIISNEAVAKAGSASARIEELGQAAHDIGKVTETIIEISDQTKLLALNATIEAARAGDAGKGFAVVANEIKDLARNTAGATHEIREKIEGIQTTTESAISEIGQVSEVIDNVNDIVSVIATAVEEQSVTMREIARSIAQVSEGISDVNRNVSESSSVSANTAREIGEVNHNIEEASRNSLTVKKSSEELLRLSGKLKKIVDQFKV